MAGIRFLSKSKIEEAGYLVFFSVILIICILALADVINSTTTGKVFAGIFAFISGFFAFTFASSLRQM